MISSQLVILLASSGFAAAVLGVALSHQYAQMKLRERIKEITCLYGIARVVAQPEASFAEIIQSIVKPLPPAWLGGLMIVGY